MQIDQNLTKKFAAWLDEGMKRCGWSMREVARRSGVSQAHISNVRRGERSVTWDLVAAISGAFGEIPEKAFRRVGLLPGQPIGLEELQEIMTHLPEAQAREVIRYAEWKWKEG